MSLYAGVIYGLVLFGVILIGLYLYQKWDAAPKSPETLKWAERVRYGLIAAFVLGMLWLGFMPLFSSTSTPPTSTPDAVATSIALTLHEMGSGTPIAFTSTEKPLASWKGIPIMSQATAGQQDGRNRYSFRVPVDSGEIASFYNDALKSQGWEIKNQQWLGVEFTKGENILLVTMAPDIDLQSWVVTLVLIQ